MCGLPLLTDIANRIIIILICSSCKYVAMCNVLPKMGTLNPTNISSWSKDDVLQWLMENNLENFKGTFDQNEIDGECLLSLDDTTLKEELGIIPLGYRQRILKRIRGLQEMYNVNEQL